MVTLSPVPQAPHNPVGRVLDREVDRHGSNSAPLWRPFYHEINDPQAGDQQRGHVVGPCHAGDVQPGQLGLAQGAGEADQDEARKYVRLA